MSRRTEGNRSVLTRHRVVAVAVVAVLVAVAAGCSSDAKESRRGHGQGSEQSRPVRATNSAPQDAAQDLDEVLASAPRIDTSCLQAAAITRRLARVKSALDAGRTLTARSLLAGTLANTEDLTDTSIIPPDQGQPMQTAMASVLSSLPGTQYQNLGDATTGNQFDQAISAVQDADQPQAAEPPIPTTVDASCEAPGADSPPGTTLGKTATDDIGIILEALLEKVPVVGSVLAVITEILWPESKEDVWESIEAKVEALVNQKIAANVKQQVDEDLQGLQNVLTDYTQTVQDEPTNSSLITLKWNTALSAFELMYPHFQSKGYEAALLGDFAQMTNLYLGLLRDGVLFGKQWGWAPATVARNQTRLTKLVGDSTTYTDTTFQAHLPVKNANPHDADQWKANNAYTRDMTLFVKDFESVWPYMDPSQHAPAKITLTRTIYSDPIGCTPNETFDSHKQFVVDPPPSQPITNLTVWGWDRIDAMMVAYGGKNGPRMGDQPNGNQGGSSDLPHGMGAAIGPGAHGPITSVSGRAGQVVEAAEFSFAANGNQPAWSSGMLGGLRGGGNPFSYAFDNETLSYVKIMGYSPFYSAADCLVYGFRYPQS